MKLLPFLIFLFIFNFSFAQIVTIPDPNFKNALLHSNCVDTNLDGFGEFDADTNNDGEIQVSEAEALVGLILFNENIDSLTGIDSFVNLELLLCNTNNLTSIDLTQNTKIAHLNLGGNQLAELNVSILPDLELLKCHANQLTAIDVSNNPSLSYFNCSSNNLSSLDVSANSDLFWLICSVNPALTSIDVSSNNALGNLYAVENNLTSLDVSNNENLITLRCENNQLTYLNIANGNNENIFRMFCFDNPDLTCIVVDDETASFPSCDYEELFEGWCKDETANYSNSCEMQVDSVSDIKLQISPNPVKNMLFIQGKNKIDSIKIFSLQGRLILNSSNQNNIDVSSLEAGVYLIEAVTNNKLVYNRFIKI